MFSLSPFPALHRQLVIEIILAQVGLMFFSSLCLAQKTAQLQIGGGRMDITFDAMPSPNLRQITLDWITKAARAVTVYYGQYPVKHVDISIHVGEGSGVGAGHAWGDDGPHINVDLGADTTLDDINDGGYDWIMTHEMVHLAFSSVEEEHHWIEEGLATYVEPIARVQAGELTAEQVWRDLIDDMPQGQPAAGDQGLDGTPTWGRTYWGGAIFCLMADMEIRKETHNRRGLQNALRGIVAAGGTINTEWGLTKVLAVGDKSLGIAVLVPLYERMRGSPRPVDLNDLWRQLGVEEKNGEVIYHDDAPLAAVRQAIMKP